MDLQKIVESLSPLEKNVLPFLTDGTEMRSISSHAKMKDIEVMRALQWLENKGIVKITSSSKGILALGENGKAYAQSGLPEKRFLEALTKKMTLSEIKNATKLDDNEVRICLGILKSRYAISILGDEVEPTSERERIVNEGFPEEGLLKKLPADYNQLSDDEKSFAERLLKRKDIIRKESEKLKYVEVTELGRKIIGASKGMKIELIENLTPQILRGKKWSGKKFRRYDIKSNVPKIYPGKRQPYGEFLHDVRRKLVALGFKEMQGPIIELEFFNFDALFQPQNHPARTWSANYVIKDPKYGRLPEPDLVKKVKASHENGWNTGSSGWQYEWNGKISSQLTPRAHDTAISPRYLASGVEIPGKYFSLVRCFRPDVIDATHGVEFNQLGGFVIDKNLSFGHLLGLLRQFVYEITGIKKVKFLPDYFPFTEPSVQVSAQHPKFGWIELAGAGVFRPELTWPLGVKEPVIAWGFGLDRLAMMKLGLKDIRDIFSGDIDFLRKSRMVL
jgi:phenylalanyl-tRNA synthetase alpha chain